MWIRSQSKLQLIKTDFIDVCEESVYCMTGQASAIIGKYDSKEEALKVLDMIANTIYGDKNQLMYAISRAGTGELAYPDTVFRMPEAGFSKEEENV